MIPLLIGAALAGGAVYALHDDKKKIRKHRREVTTTRILSEDELPQWVREKFSRDGKEPNHDSTFNRRGLNCSRCAKR